MLVIDVDYNSFKSYLRNNVSFYWTETKNSFILIKPTQDEIVRTIVMKTTKEKDEAFRLKELYKQTARFVLNFTIDGESVVKIFSTPKPTEGEVKYEKPKIEIGEH